MDFFARLPKPTTQGWARLPQKTPVLLKLNQTRLHQVLNSGELPLNVAKDVKVHHNGRDELIIRAGTPITWIAKESKTPHHSTRIQASLPIERSVLRTDRQGSLSRPSRHLPVKFTVPVPYTSMGKNKAEEKFFREMSESQRILAETMEEIAVIPDEMDL